MEHYASSKSGVVTAQGVPEIYAARREDLERRSEARRCKAIDKLREQLRRNDRAPQRYIRLADCHWGFRDFAKALAVLKVALARCAPHPRLYRRAISALEQCNRTGDALQLARRARALFPGRRSFAVQQALLLPIVYDRKEDIDHWRKRFARGLRRLLAALILDTPAARREAMDATSRYSNFFLAYQARNDRQLQRLYGTLVHRIMAATYPDWVKPLGLPPRLPGERIRVGYISSCFSSHTVAKLFGGWLVAQSRDEFELFAYHVGGSSDRVTEEIRRAVDHFRESRKVEGVAGAVLSDRLHVGVFLDIGMHPRMTQLAALRLAPIQCMAWGHPMTSGLPTMDYFLSSELMEPEGAEDHYSEHLIRLPGIGVCYQKPIIPRVLLHRTRSDFGLREKATVYLCCQSSFKYLPQFDSLFVQIARRVPTSQFVFVAENDLVGADLSRRLERAFSKAGLQAGRHCVFLPWLSIFDYWNVHLVSDVYLDSCGWSGGNTTLEAIACGLPVVTWPGRFLRARHSYAMLTQLGVTDTIAQDEEHYVEIAVRLGREPRRRGEIVERMVKSYPSLYSDGRSVQALEGFFRRVVAERLGGGVGEARERVEAFRNAADAPQ